MIPSISRIAGLAPVVLPQALALAEPWTRTVDEVWKQNGRPLDDGERRRVSSSLSTGLSVVGAHHGDVSLAGLEVFWDSIPFATSQRAFPRIATPEESAMSHLNGLLLLRERWGDGVAHCWRQAHFASMAEDHGIPLSSLRDPLDGGFLVTTAPGGQETVAGVEYRLIWEEADKSFPTDFEVANVGFVSRRDGLGITLVQGGYKLTGVPIRQGDKETNLLKLAQKRFGQDPRAWLLAETIRRIRRDYGPVPLYWLRAERRAPLYGHILDTTVLHETRMLSSRTGHASLRELEALLTQSTEDSHRILSALREKGRKQGWERRDQAEFDIHARNSQEVARMPIVMRRLNEMAAHCGFRDEDPESAWWVLPTASEA